MKKMGDLMKELGFREEGAESVKRAFVENLRRVLEQQEAGRRSPPRGESVSVSSQCPVVKSALEKETSGPQQLSLFETESSPRRTRRPRAG